MASGVTSAVVTPAAAQASSSRSPGSLEHGSSNAPAPGLCSRQAARPDRWLRRSLSAEFSPLAASTSRTAWPAGSRRRQPPGLPVRDRRVAVVAERGQVPRPVPGVPAADVVDLGRAAPRTRRTSGNAASCAARICGQPGGSGGLDQYGSRRCAGHQPVSSAYSGQYRFRQPRTRGISRPAPGEDAPACRAAPGAGTRARDLAAARPAGSRAAPGAAGPRATRTRGHATVTTAGVRAVMLTGGGCGRVMVTTGHRSTSGGAAGSGAADRVTPCWCAWPSRRSRPARRRSPACGSPCSGRGSPPRTGPSPAG